MQLLIELGHHHTQGGGVGTVEAAGHARCDDAELIEQAVRAKLQSLERLETDQADAGSVTLDATIR